jgi:hypothetical protein
MQHGVWMSPDNASIVEHTISDVGMIERSDPAAKLELAGGLLCASNLTGRDASMWPQATSH